MEESCGIRLIFIFIFIIIIFFIIFIFIIIFFVFFSFFHLWHRRVGRQERDLDAVAWPRLR